jgi:hypothetical protein
MIRPILAASMLVIVGLLTAAPVAAAETDAPEVHSAYTSFKLEATHGLQVHVYGQDDRGSPRRSARGKFRLL